MDAMLEARCCPLPAAPPFLQPSQISLSTSSRRAESSVPLFRAAPSPAVWLPEQLPLPPAVAVALPPWAAVDSDAPLFGCAGYPGWAPGVAVVLDGQQAAGDRPGSICTARSVREEEEGGSKCKQKLFVVFTLQKRQRDMFSDPGLLDFEEVQGPDARSSSSFSRFSQIHALLCDDHASRVPLESFKVVLLRTNDVPLDADPHSFAFLYESKANVWSNIISYR